MSTLCTPQTFTGYVTVVVHSEWEYLNEITSSIHGNNIVNNDGAMILKERKSGSSNDKTRFLPLFDRTKPRSLKVAIPDTLPPLDLHIRVGPRFSAGASSSYPVNLETQYAAALHTYYILLLYRRVGNRLREARKEYTRDHLSSL